MPGPPALGVAPGLAGQSPGEGRAGPPAAPELTPLFCGEETPLYPPPRPSSLVCTVSQSHFSPLPGLKRRGWSVCLLMSRLLETNGF